MSPSRRPTSRGSGDAATIDWLLEPDQPAVRHRALVDLLGRRPDDPDVRAARARIPRTGWAADLLEGLHAWGFWEPRGPRNLKEYVDFLYYPKYVSTNWKALVLSDLGLDRSHPKVRKLAEAFFEFKLRLSSPFNYYHEEVCAAGNTARVLTRFGYDDDPRVRRLYDWLVEDQREDGGWNCSQGTPGTLDGWEALAAFASLLPARRSRAVRDSIARGAEFYLERRLFHEGNAYPPWLRLHYPTHYYYDVLVGLDLLTQLGYAGDRRLAPALRTLREKRRPDGTWWMDRVHPDVPAGAGGTDAKKVKPFALEAPGRPSKWITLLALRVLRRVDEAA